MPRTQATESLELPTLTIVIFAILLLFPLVELPRPTLITTPPWKVELLVSLSLLTVLLFIPKPAIPTSFSFRNFLLILGLFIIWSGSSAIWAANLGPVIHHTLIWTVYGVFFLVFLSVLQRSRGIKNAIVLAAAITLSLSTLCILDFVTLVDFTASEGTLRIRWAKYAELLVTIVPFLWAVASQLRGRDRLIVLGIGIAGWIAAMLSLSRSAFIAGTIGFAILFLSLIVFSSRRVRSTALLFAASWIAITVGFQTGSAYLTSVPATTQYITGAADATRSTATMRVFTWTVTGTMIKDSPFLGVGADNFGAAFVGGRKVYAAANPLDPNSAIGEDYLFERAHNEYLQIAAELGVPGLLLFATAFLVFGIWLFRFIWGNRSRVSPPLLGAAAGMAAFAVSSLFTSFSFRAFQNGIAFFAMAAVATYLVSRRDLSMAPENSRFLFPISVLATVGLAIFSGLVATSQIFSTIGERQVTAEETKQNFEYALAFYPENGGTQLSLASAEAKTGSYREAADLARASIANGVGASVAYTSLAEYEEKAGDSQAAIGAVDEGIAAFPRSSYLRAYLVLLLERTGDRVRAEKEMRIARELDAKQVNGWHALIKSGSRDAYQISRSDPNTAGPAELVPQNAIYPYLTEDMTP